MAVGLKTLLEAAQYLEEQEQQQKSPPHTTATLLNTNHLNGIHHLSNEANSSCFIAHYSLAVAAPKNNTSHDEHHMINGNGSHHNVTDSMETLNSRKTTTTTIIPATTNALACQGILKNPGNKKHQIAASAPASSSTFQQVALGNGFSLTAKTQTPADLYTTGKNDAHDSNPTPVNITNLNNNQNNTITNNKGQLLTAGTLIQQHANNHNHNCQTNSNSNTNTSPSNILHTNNNNNNNNKQQQLHIKNNHHLDEFDSNSLSPPAVGRVRSASTSSNVYVLGHLDSKSSNRLQTNVLHSSATDSKCIQMMLVNDVTGTNNLTANNWLINNQSPQRNCMENISGIGNQMEVMSPKTFGGIGSQTLMNIPSISSNGRRRTISSTSNGAGTREVHNKLEKNRRAHLKECYEKLKNQLNLKDEDRKKTSNLAVLGEALNQVISLQEEAQELEAKIEQLAKDKINSQKRIVMLKRELGPRYEQIFSGIFPDIEMTMASIPNERENFNNTSLSSGRGSILYSSSNSLSSSSGGSTCSNLLSSPGGVNQLQTNTTTIMPVISKNNTVAMKMTGIVNAAIATTTSANTSNTTSSSAVKINNELFLQQQQQQQQLTNINGKITAQQSPVSPTVSTVLGVNNLVISTTNNGNNHQLPLSLTAKNISDTSLTRGSPTPSTPSPSPSSSSGVSSSSSFISSSPPMSNGSNSNSSNSGNINCNSNLTTVAAATTPTTRQVCINIPNGLKFHVANGSIVASGGVNNNNNNGVASFQGTTQQPTTTTNNNKNGNYHP